MAISPQFLDELRARTGLADVIQRRVKLTRRGREHIGLCPFHKEKTPSFTVNEEKGFYHCFGCGAHGGAIDFVMHSEGLSFPETVERLAAAAGMAVPADTPEERERARRRRDLLEIVEAATAQFEKRLRLPEGRAALGYLTGRGLDGDTIDRFRLGYAPGGRGALKAALARQGIDEERMVEAGLLVHPDEADRQPYERFRNRIIFPITDRRGRVIAFGGRILDAAGVGAGRPAEKAAGVGAGRPAEKAAGVGAGRPAEKEAPKYLNSPETPLFRKGRVLYGMAQAQAQAREAGRIIVTEGYMDVIALHMAGFEETVAPLGTALTEDHLRELWRTVREPVLCFDGDAAGGRAAARAAERALPLLRAGYSLSFATMPAGQDPDSLIRRDGAAAMRRIVEAAVSFSEVLWHLETGGRSLSRPEERAALQKRLDGHTRRITDTTVRAHFRDAFRERLWRRRRGAAGPPDGAPSADLDPALGPATRVDRTRRREQILLALLVNHPELSDAWTERLGTMAFSAPELDKLRQEALKTLAAGRGLDSVALENHLRERGFSDSLDSVLSPEVYTHADFARPGAPPERARRGWEGTFERFRQEDLPAEIREAARRFAEDPTDENSQRLTALKSMTFEAAEHANRLDEELERAGG